MPAVDETTRLGLRTLLVTSTGHYHLVGTQEVSGDTVPDFTVDAGADAFLNRSIKWWDRQARHSRKLSKRSLIMAAGDYFIEVPGCHGIIELRCTDSQTFLQQTDEQWMFENLGADLTAVSQSATPLYWAKKIPDATVTAASDVVWIMPPVSEEKTVEVVGYYYSFLGTADTDTCWWTLNFSEGVLYVAAQMVNDIDLNPFTNATLKQMVESVKHSMLSDDIAEEVAFYGSVMAG